MTIRLPGEGVGWVGPMTVKLTARQEELCQLIERMDQATGQEAFLRLVSEFAAIRAFAMAEKCQRMAE